MSALSRLPTRLAEVAFILWCFVVGTLLVYAPWMPIWLRWSASFHALTLGRHPLSDLVAHPLLRSAVSGFGLYHLVWATHDLDRILGRWLEHRRGGPR